MYRPETRRGRSSPRPRWFQIGEWGSATLGEEQGATPSRSLPEVHILGTKYYTSFMLPFPKSDQLHGPGTHSLKAVNCHLVCALLAVQSQPTVVLPARNRQSDALCWTLLPGSELEVGQVPPNQASANRLLGKMLVLWCGVTPAPGAVRNPGSRPQASPTQSQTLKLPIQAYKSDGKWPVPMNDSISSKGIQGSRERACQVQRSCKAPDLVYQYHV